MATKKTTKKTAAKKSAKKTAKKSVQKKVENQESLIAKEVDQKLEEQKEEISNIESISSSQIDKKEETTESDKKYIYLISFLIIILVLIGYFSVFKKEKKTEVETSKIQTNEQQKPTEQQVNKPEESKQQEIAKPEEKKQEEKQYEEYTIQKGDLLATIMRKFNKTQKELQEANPGVDWSKIKAGQVIKIPK